MILLVTGGCGFIGANFIKFILSEKEDIEVINFDKLTYSGNTGTLRHLEGDRRYSFIRGDICDKEAVSRAVAGADIVVNFAAESHVDRSIKYPDDFVMTNYFGVKNLLEAARVAKVSRFVQIGTDEVYGTVPDGLSKETDPLRPASPYSASKAAADLLALSYFSTYRLPVIVTRSSNNYGPFQYPEKVIPLFITNILSGVKVPLYGDGGNVRDWIYVEDNCEAILTLIEKGIPGEIYNIGGGNRVSNIELTRLILEMMGRNKGWMEFVNDRPGHDRRYALDASKAKKLGWDTKTDFQEGVRKTIDWYGGNEAWWRPLIEKAEIIKW